jgi:hypothetical protein
VAPPTESDLLHAFLEVQDKAGPKTALNLTVACERVLAAAVGLDEATVARATDWALRRAKQRAVEAEAAEMKREKARPAGTVEGVTGAAVAP